MRPLLLRHVDGRLHAVLEVGLLDVRNHADDLDLVDDALAELTNAIPPGRQLSASGHRDTPADRDSAPSRYARAYVSIDDGDTRRAAPIGRLEQPAGERADAERREELRRNLVAVRELIGDGCAAADDGVGRESDGEQPLVQRRSGRCARGSDAGQRLDAADELLVELRHPQHARAVVDRRLCRS